MGWKRNLLLAGVFMTTGFALGRLLAREGAPPPETRDTCRGNPGSKIVHRPGCRYYNPDTLTVAFTSIAAANASGYRSCKLCI